MAGPGFWISAVGFQVQPKPQTLNPQLDPSKETFTPKVARLPHETGFRLQLLTVSFVCVLGLRSASNWSFGASRVRPCKALWLKEDSVSMPKLPHQLHEAEFHTGTRIYRDTIRYDTV